MTVIAEFTVDQFPFIIFGYCTNTVIIPTLPA